MDKNQLNVLISPNQVEEKKLQQCADCRQRTAQKPVSYTHLDVYKRQVLTIGLVLYAVAFACPLLFQGASWTGAVFYIFFEAIANAFVIPRKESLLFLYVDKKERSRVYAMLHVIALAITSPFGTVMGAMSCLLYTSSGS